MARFRRASVRRATEDNGTRSRRISFGRIERQVTLLDEEFYQQPIVLDLPMSYAADTDMLEYVSENPRSQPHLVGRTERARNRRAAGATGTVHGRATARPSGNSWEEHRHSLVHSVTRRRSNLHWPQWQGAYAGDANIGVYVWFAAAERAVRSRSVWKRESRADSGGGRNWQIPSAALEWRAT